MLRVLVDYDNLPKYFHARGLVYSVHSILALLPQADITPFSQVSFRLYGGWYSSGSTTHRAQHLSAEIQANFPLVINHQVSGNKLLTNAELALSLLLTPREHIFDTFRIRAFPSNIKCDHPSLHGCLNPNCPVNRVHEFITKGKCKGQCCGIKPNDILYKGEQKLVDTMLTSDIFYSAMNSFTPLVLVTSDDDFWPGIRTSLFLGTDLVHIHTKHRKTPSHYSQFVGSNYRQFNL